MGARDTESARPVGARVGVWTFYRDLPVGEIGRLHGNPNLEDSPNQDKWEYLRGRAILIVPNGGKCQFCQQPEYDVREIVDSPTSPAQLYACPTIALIGD